MKKINFKDFNKIMDGARRHLKDQSAPLYLSNQEVVGRGINQMGMDAHLAVIESVINFLGSEGLLKDNVTIEYHKSAVESDDQY